MSHVDITSKMYSNSEKISQRNPTERIGSLVAYSFFSKKYYQSCPFLPCLEKRIVSHVTPVRLCHAFYEFLDQVLLSLHKSSKDSEKSVSFLHTKSYTNIETKYRTGYDK